MRSFNNFKNITSQIELNENEYLELGNIFDNIHTKILNNEVRNFNRGEYSKYYSNKENIINFKVPTTIIIYWNHKSIFYFHQSNELIYIPKTLTKKIMDKYDTIQHENSPHIFRNNLQHIFSWDSKYLNDNWSTLNIIQ